MINSEIIYFDVDGTLYDNEKDQLNPEIISALKQLKENGYKIALCTGRTKDGLNIPNLLTEVKWDGYVLANGGQVFDEDFNQLRSVTCEPDFIHELIKLNNGPLFLEGDQNTLTDVADERTIAGFTYFGNGVADLPPVVPYTDQPVYKLITFDIDSIENGINNPIFDNYEVLINAANSHEIFPKNSGKHLGVETLNEHLNITRHTAFGDGNNDVEFLEHADFSVAMGNATKHLKTIADFVTADVTDNGVAVALKKYQLID